MRTLLVILAHPDDESFGPGGTLARYAHNGVSVHYLCGTRGESGTVDAHRLNGYASVGELRTAELMCAAQRLGLAGVHFLGYRDSGMAGVADNSHVESLHTAPLDDVAKRIVSYIDDLQPDAIVTHDQFGGYGHPDHIKLHEATMRAYEMRFGLEWRPLPDGLWSVARPPAGQPPRLYFFTIPKGLVKFGVRLLPLLRQDPRKFGRNKDIDLMQIASWDVPATTRVNTRGYERFKMEASECHASQQPPAQQNRVVRFLFRRSGRVEYFSRAFPPFEQGERPETGLFGD
jgi:LmbE family N-acetylglucosaminyl deacetylase